MFLFFRRLLELVRPYRFRLGMGVCMGVLCGLVEPLLMLCVKLVVDVLFPTVGRNPLLDSMAGVPGWLQPYLTGLQAVLRDVAHHPAAMVLVVGTIPTVMFLRGVFGYLNIYFLQWVAVRVVTHFRSRLFAHLFNLDLSFFTRSSTGELMSRVLNDIGVLQNTVSYHVATIVKEPVTLLSLLGFLLWQNPKLTLISLAVVPICAIPITIYSRKVRRTSAEIQTRFAELSTIMHESFTGNRIVKAYNLEAHVVQRFHEASAKFISHSMRLVRASELPGPMIEFFGALGVAIFLGYVALGTGMKTTPGDFLQLVGSIFLMYRPIKQLTRLHSNLEQARAATERIFHLLETKSAIVEPTHPVSLQAAGAGIEFDGVNFSYGEKQVLHDFRLTVNAGKLVALVGSSGSGKTTVTNLLLRFYDPQQGAVRIGGTDIRAVHTRDLRSQIAVVTQEAILFNDTIRSNIAMGRPAATEAEIVAAARHAHAHEFICDKPQGYDTVIGEKGVALSGGQRQRLATARAILKNAPILVLDEATSALDTESERAVQAALEDLMEGRTTICIAHRLSTIQKADLIVVLEQGRIAETGTHAELLAHGRVYRKLHDLQFNA